MASDLRGAVRVGRAVWAVLLAPVLIALGCGDRASGVPSGTTASTVGATPDAINECHVGGLRAARRSERGEKVIVADPKHADPDVVIDAVVRHARRSFTGAELTRYRLPIIGGTLDLTAASAGTHDDIVEFELLQVAPPFTLVTVAVAGTCVYVERWVELSQRTRGPHAHPCSIGEARKQLIESGVPADERGWLSYNAFNGQLEATDFEWSGSEQTRRLDPATCGVLAPPPHELRPASEEDRRNKEVLQRQLEQQGKRREEQGPRD